MAYYWSQIIGMGVIKVRAYYNLLTGGTMTAISRYFMQFITICCLSLSLLLASSADVIDTGSDDSDGSNRTVIDNFDGYVRDDSDTGSEVQEDDFFGNGSSDATPLLPHIAAMKESEEKYYDSAGPRASGVMLEVPYDSVMHKLEMKHDDSLGGSASSMISDPSEGAPDSASDYGSLADDETFTTGQLYGLTRSVGSDQHFGDDAENHASNRSMCSYVARLGFLCFTGCAVTYLFDQVKTSLSLGVLGVGLLCTSYYMMCRNIMRDTTLGDSAGMRFRTDTMAAPADRATGTSSQRHVRTTTLTAVPEVHATEGTSTASEQFMTKVSETCLQGRKRTATLIAQPKGDIVEALSTPKKRSRTTTMRRKLKLD